MRQPQRLCLGHDAAEEQIRPGGQGGRLVPLLGAEAAAQPKKLVTRPAERGPARCCCFQLHPCSRVKGAALVPGRMLAALRSVLRSSSLPVWAGCRAGVHRDALPTGLPRFPLRETGALAGRDDVLAHKCLPVSLERIGF